MTKTITLLSTLVVVVPTLTLLSCTTTDSPKTAGDSKDYRASCYYATGDFHRGHADAWYGPLRSLRSAAQADVDEHNAFIHQGKLYATVAIQGEPGRDSDGPNFMDGCF
jgi:hypothetical protein